MSSTGLPRSVERPTRLRHFVLAALLVITSINYIQRNADGPAAPVIKSDLSLNAKQVGWVMSAFFLSYTIMQVPAGWFAQRIGARWALVLIAAGWSLAMAGSALARNFAELIAARLCLGALQAGIFSCATLILSVWYPASRRGVATALLNSFMAMGGAASAMLTGYLLQPLYWHDRLVLDLGWRGVFALYAVPGLLWAAWFAWWFRSRPQDHPGVNQAELEIIAGGPAPLSSSPLPRFGGRGVGGEGEGIAPAEAIPHPQPLSPAVGERGERQPLTPNPSPLKQARGEKKWLLALMSFSLLLICTQQFFRAGANRLFDKWLPTWFVQQRGAGIALAGFLSSMPQWAIVFGGLTGGMISDRILALTARRDPAGRGNRWAARNGVALFGLLSGICCYVTAYMIGNVTAATVVLSAGAFLFSFSSPCAYALTMDVGGRYLGVVFGVMNMIGNLGAYSFITVVPYLVEWGGWDLALAVFAGMNLAAAVCWLFLNPNIVIGEPSRSPAGAAP